MSEKEQKTRSLSYIIWFDDSTGWFSGIASVYSDSLEARLKYVPSNKRKHEEPPSVEVTEIIGFKRLALLCNGGNFLQDILFRRLSGTPWIHFTGDFISFPTGSQGGIISFIALSEKEYLMLKRANELQDYVDEYYSLLKGLKGI